LNKDSKIYLAGHNGLVGSAIYKALIEKGYSNIVTRSSKELDLTDLAATESFFESEKPEYVFLAAAKVGGIMANNTYRADFIYQNMLIQNNVVGMSHKYHVKKLLFLGSSCIYPKNAPQPITEDSLLTSELEYTNEPYAIAKIAGIKLIESFNIQYGTNFLAVMPTNLYGHNDNYDLEKSHVLPAMIRKMYLARLLEKNDLNAIRENLGESGLDDHNLELALNKYGIARSGDKVTLSLWGTGKPMREFMHSTDMAAACVYVMENINFSDLSIGMAEIRNTHLNVSTGSDLSIKDLALLIKAHIGFEGEIEFDATKPDGTMRKLMSPDKLAKLGWMYSIKLEDGLKTVIDDYIAGQHA